MMQYQQPTPQFLQPKKSFTIKKPKRIITLRTQNPPLLLITNSEPVTPSRPTICTEIKSQRNTIDYFIQFTEKNREVLVQKQMFLPSLGGDSDSNKLIKGIRPSYSKKRSLQKEIVMGREKEEIEMDVKMNIWKKKRVGTSSGTQRVRIESAVREKAMTIDVDKPTNRIMMKPLIIQNKFLSKFTQLKKPSSHQMRYFRNKVIKPTLQNPQQMLFTFYPKQDYCKTEMVNQFLDIN